MNKLYRIIIILLAGIVLLSATGAAAYADVIWEPMKDSFYAIAYEDCEPMGRSFIANSSEGYVTVYKQPGSGSVVDRFENGNVFYVSFTYQDTISNTWGVVQYTVNEDHRAVISYSDNARTGWIKMHELIVEYDNLSFTEDHSAEFKEYAGQFDSYDADGKTILFWSYPGSGVISSKLSSDEIDERFSISHTYTDENGLLWGYVGYFMGRRDWFCISDPSNEDLPVVTIEYSNLHPASNPGNSPDQFFTLILMIILVILVVAATAILIRLFWRKNDSKAGENPADTTQGKESSGHDAP